MVLAGLLCIFRLYVVCLNNLHLMSYMYKYECVQSLKVLTALNGACRCCYDRLSISEEIKRSSDTSVLMC